MELAELEKRRDELLKVVQAQVAKAEEIKTVSLINRGRLEEVLALIAKIEAQNIHDKNEGR
jgi:hypothetical protein